MAPIQICAEVGGSTGHTEWMPVVLVLVFYHNSSFLYFFQVWIFFFLTLIWTGTYFPTVSSIIQREEREEGAVPVPDMCGLRSLCSNTRSVSFLLVLFTQQRWATRHWRTKAECILNILVSSRLCYIMTFCRNMGEICSKVWWKCLEVQKRNYIARMRRARNKQHPLEINK